MVRLPDGLRLRELAPDDGPAIARLSDASPDAGAVRFRQVYAIDPYVALTFDGDETGVVVERDGEPGLVGMGMVRFDVAMFRGTPTPYALLHALIVHPDARRQGVARSIIAWRQDRVRERLGDDAVVMATIQRGNAGSLAAASKWATQFSRPLTSSATRTRSKPPSTAPELRVRPAETGDLDAFVAGYDAFHAGFELWPSVSAESLADRLVRSPAPDLHPNTLWVVEDAAGNLLGGLETREGRGIGTLHVEAMPTVMRLFNRVIHVVPTDGVMEQVFVGHGWFGPGQAAAASHLYEVVRWEMRTRGTTLIVAFDGAGPLRPMFVGSRFQPSTSFSLAIRSPEPLRPDIPIEPVQ